MREIFMDRTEYLKALRNQNPMDHFSESKSTVNRIGRITARILNNNPDFHEALKQSGTNNLAMARAGNMFHNMADRVTKAMVARGKIPAGTEMSSEHTIKEGRGGSRADNLSWDKASNKLSEFDYKTGAKGALRSKSQLDKHAVDLEKKGYGKPAVQESRNWPDYVRETGPNAAKFLPKLNTSNANSSKLASKPSATPASMRHSQTGSGVPPKPGSASKGPAAMPSSSPSPSVINTPKNVPSSGMPSS